MFRHYCLFQGTKKLAKVTHGMTQILRHFYCWLVFSYPEEGTDVEMSVVYVTNFGTKFITDWFIVSLLIG